MRTLVPLLALAACSRTKGEIVATPSSIEWGEVDFQADVPVEGYAVVDLTVLNDSTIDADVRITEFDSLRLRLGAALLASQDPPTLSTLAPGQQVVIQIGVIHYEPGERDNEVSGKFYLEADKLVWESVPWSFTPIRQIDTDTFE